MNKKLLNISVSIIILYFLIFNYSYGDTYRYNKNTDVNLSIDEFIFILDKIIKPDFLANKSDYLCFEKIELQSESISNVNRFYIALEETNGSIISQQQPITVKYALFKRKWCINNNNIWVFSISGPPWKKPSPQRVLAKRDDNSMYLLSGFQSNDFSSLVHKIVSRSDISKSTFYDICYFYLTNIYAKGFYVKVLNCLSDINFNEPQETSDPLWNQYVEKFSKNSKDSEEKESMEKYRIDMLEFLKPEIVINPPVLNVENERYKLTLFTYFYRSGDIIKWNFSMGSNKELKVQKKGYFRNLFPTLTIH